MSPRGPLQNTAAGPFPAPMAPLPKGGVPPLSMHRPVSIPHPKGSRPVGAGKNQRFLPEGFTAGTSSKYKPMWKPTSLLSPRFGYRQTTPLWQGGLWSMHLLHRSNDTGRVREITITDQLGAHCHRGHPGGGSPEMLKRNLQIPLAFFRGLGYIIEVLALRCFEC